MSSIFYSNTVDIGCEIECPSCGQRTWAKFSALVGSGEVPETRESCGACGIALTIQADLDISVEASNASD